MKMECACQTMSLCFGPMTIGAIYVTFLQWLSVTELVVQVCCGSGIRDLLPSLKLPIGVYYHFDLVS